MPRKILVEEKVSKMLNGTIYKISLALVILSSCGPTEEESSGTILSSSGEEMVDTVQMVNEYDLNEQPLLLYYFFHLGLDQIGTDYCYDDQQIKDLLMGGIEVEFGWTSSKVTDSYLRIESSECFVTTEFKVIEVASGTTLAYLLQTSKNDQQFTAFSWNEGGQEWVINDDVSKPKMTDFFSDLSESERQTVKKYGYYYAYLNEATSELSFDFSTWQMGLNLDGKELLEFEKEPDFSFGLMFDSEDRWWLKKIYKNEAKIPKRYFLAYSEDGETSQDFDWFTEGIKKGLKGYKVESAFSELANSNYKAVFSNRTFDLSSMQQFEPRNGFWFYEEGKEPLDLGYDQVEVILPQAKRYFDEYWSF